MRGRRGAMRLLPADLRLRLGAGLGALLLLTPLSQPGPALAALAAAAALLAHERPALDWHRLFHLEAFLLLLLLTLPFVVPGTPVWRLGPLAASAEGLMRALTLSAKVSASVLFLATALAGVAPEALAGALRALRLPEPLLRLFLSLVRYLGLIRAEMDRLFDALRARGFRPATNLHSLRTYGLMIGMMLVRALARAQRVEEAMRLRGPSGQFLATALPRPARADWGLAALPVLLSGALLAWELL